MQVNVREAKVLQAILGGAGTIREIAREAFPNVNPITKADSWVRNCVRRPAGIGWVRRVGSGLKSGCYKIDGRSAEKVREAIADPREPRKAKTDKVKAKAKTNKAKTDKAKTNKVKAKTDKAKTNKVKAKTDKVKAKTDKVKAKAKTDKVKATKPRTKGEQIAAAQAEIKTLISSIGAKDEIVATEEPVEAPGNGAPPLPPL